MDPLTLSLLIAAGGMGASTLAGMGGQGQGSYSPLPYTAEKGAINPTLWAFLNKQMEGKPQDEDWQGLGAANAQIQQNYKDALQSAGTNFAGRGVFDSGWMQQRKGGLLSQRAGQESGANANMWQNILGRQLQAQNMTQQLLAGARAGSGTYKTKQTDWNKVYPPFWGAV